MNVLGNKKSAKRIVVNQPAKKWEKMVKKWGEEIWKKLKKPGKLPAFLVGNLNTHT